jgi:hypothetical protein
MYFLEVCGLSLFAISVKLELEHLGVFDAFATFIHRKLFVKE